MIDLLWWTDDLETGVASVDQQHKAIFLKAHEIFNMGENTELEELKEITSFLMSYTNKHFLDEEELMIETSYPGYEAHKESHNEFVKKVYEIYLKIEENRVDEDFFNDLKILIIQWLARHINDEDKKFIDYYNSVIEN